MRHFQDREREGNSRNNRNKQKGLNQKSFEWINVTMVFLEFRLRRYASSKYDSWIRLGLIEPRNSLFFFLLDLNQDRQGLVIAFYFFSLVVRRGSTPLCAWRANPEEFYCIGRQLHLALKYKYGTLTCTKSHFFFSRFCNPEYTVAN